MKLKDDKDQKQLVRLYNSLETVRNFVKNHERLNYLEFDYYVAHELCLFTMDLTLDFAMLDEFINLTSKTLPSIKHVFAKPIIELKDEADVRPVESVRTINENTIHYLQTHACDVGNIKGKKIKPKKLLTRIYDDNYAIYENVIVCNFIDDAISYIKASITSLKEIIYTKEVTKVNLLDRVNHINYFLALGKLQTSYVKHFNKYYMLANKDLDELFKILPVIKARTQTKLYQKNRRRNHNLKLHKTNIFLMQKDYRAIYKLYNFLKTKALKKKSIEDPNLEEVLNNYIDYLKILVIFSLGHFNFITDDEIDLKHLNVNFKLDEWLINLKEEETSLILSFRKDKTYKLKLVPLTKKTNLERSLDSDDTVFVSYQEEPYLKTDKLFISIENVDSFRRIQALILKGMIESDLKREKCPFCQETLSFNPSLKLYECPICKTEIHDAYCLTKQKEYHYTKLAHFKAKTEDLISFRDDEWLYNRKIESMMYFRNITKIDENGEIVCPLCGKVHES